MFWEFHDIIFSNHVGENVGSYRTDNLIGFATELEMDTVEFESCMEEEKYRGYIMDTASNARSSFGVRSTPTLVINGVVYIGIMDITEYQAIIEAELAAIASP